MEIFRNIKTLLDERLRLLAKLPPEANLIQVILGPRQVGKTTAVQQIVRTWQGPVVFESADQLIAPNIDWILTQWQKARTSDPKTTLLVLDEIQKIPGWSSAVKSLIDEERSRRSGLRVVLLGSASWSISQGLGDSLAGRFEIIRAHHWTFGECEALFGWTLREFLKFGGYPVPSQFIGDKDRWQGFIQSSIVEPTLAKDILPLRQVSKPALFRQAFTLSMSYPAQEIALHKMLGQLQDGGNVTTLKGYLDMLDAGYVLRQLEKFSTRPLTKKSSAPKLLPMCGALVHAFTDPEEVDRSPDWFGRVFENAIGAHLCANLEPQYGAPSSLGDKNVTYWRDGNAEIDFVVRLDNEIFGIEVKSGRKKSPLGAQAFKKAFPNARVIVMDTSLGERFLREVEIKKFLQRL